MRLIICRIFLAMGIFFSVVDLRLSEWSPDLMGRLLIGLVAAGLLWLILRILGKLFRRMGGLLPIAVGLSLALLIPVTVLYENSTPSALAIAAITCYIVYGLCISGTRHAARPGDSR